VNYDPSIVTLLKLGPGMWMCRKPPVGRVFRVARMRGLSLRQPDWRRGERARFLNDLRGGASLEGSGSSG
jgi:hypothetical protein